MTTEEAIQAVERMIHIETKWPGTEETVEALEMAIAALRAQQEQEKPQPLTLEELRQMNGEPVWCVDGSGNEMWGLVNAEHGEPDVIDYESGLWRGDFYNMAEDRGKGLNPIGWLAYRHKPKEEKA